MRRSAWSAVRAVLVWFAFSLGFAPSMAAAPARLSPPALTVGSAAQLSLGAGTFYWFDDSGALTAPQVAARAGELPWRMRLRDGQGGSHGVLWILFDVSLPSQQQWYLEVGASTNDRLDLFYQERPGAWVQQEAGATLPVSRWTVPGRLPTFRLAAGAGGPVRYLLRVEDDGAEFLAPLMLLREDLLPAHREHEQFLLGAYFGLLALIALAALANGAMFRDRAFLVFACYILLLGLGQLARVGLGAQHLWSEWPVLNERMLALWPGAAAAAGLWLVKVITDPARLSRGLDLGAWALIAALLAATAVHAFIDTRTSMALVLALTGLGMGAVVSMVLWGWLDGRERSMSLVALACLPMVVLALFPLARGFGLSPPNVLTRYGLFLGTMLQLPLLYQALNTRLMLRREAELRASALSRTDPLTGLPHRRALTDRLDASLAHARAQKQQCALLAIRAANLQAIAEEFGRDAVDKALVITASHLRRMTVGYDMAARVGEREFAMLVEAPATREAATSRAQQVVASGLREVDALPGAILRFHVVVAMLPRPDLDGAGSLQHVLHELDAITPDARKLIRWLDSVRQNGG